MKKLESNIVSTWVISRNEKEKLCNFEHIFYQQLEDDNKYFKNVKNKRKIVQFQ